MTVKSGVTGDTPGRIFIDAGAVYLNYGLVNERLLGATRGGNEFNLNRVVKNIEADGLKGPVRGMKRVTEVGPQITANLLELTVANLVVAIAGATQGDFEDIESEYVGVGDKPNGGGTVEFPLNQNDVVENSERVYLSDANGKLTLKTRSKKYASRFVGDKATENKEFETGTGNWEKHADMTGVLSYATGGFKGNCMKYTGGSTETRLLLVTLAGGDGAVLTNLVIGQHYRIQLAIKKGTWSGTITLACAGAPVFAAITPTAYWTVYVYEFIADATDATLTLTGVGNPGEGDTIYFDFFELEQVDGHYVMKWNGGDKEDGAKYASVIFPEESEPTSANQIIVSYTYEKTAPGDHTVITGGEIDDTDYIENVAIVGNISGKNKAVICMVKNVLADAGFSLSTAPRDEAVPVVVFTGHYHPSTLDTEPWEIRYPND